MQTVLTQGAETWGPMLALGLFLACFIGIVIWVFRPGSSTIYNRASKLPFMEGLKNE